MSNGIKDFLEGKLKFRWTEYGKPPIRWNASDGFYWCSVRREYGLYYATLEKMWGEPVVLYRDTFHTLADAKCALEHEREIRCG